MTTFYQQSKQSRMQSTCFHCGNVLFISGPCPGCGSSARVERVDPERQFENGQPFHYKGMMIWPVRDYTCDIQEFHFYLGDRLLEIVKVTIELLQALKETDPSVSNFDFVYRLFKIMHGETDMEIIEDNSRRIPALVVMTRVEYPREQLTWESVLERFKEKGMATL